MISHYLLGGSGQRKIRPIDGAPDWRSGLRPPRGHCGGQAQNGHDGLRLPDVQGLRPEHGQQEEVHQRQRHRGRGRPPGGLPRGLQ